MKEEDYLQYIEDIKNMNEDELRQHLISFYKSILLSNEIKERLNNIINELVLSCYGSDMSLAEFENIWEIAFNKKYNPKEIDKLKELKEGKE